MEIYVARQPIFDRKKGIFGYELLFRAADLPDAGVQALYGDTFTGPGMTDLVGDKRPFIHLSRNQLLDNAQSLSAQQEAVVEIPKSLDPTPELIEVCQALSRKGCTIALEGIEPSPEHAPLIEIAGIIRFDFRNTSIEDIQACLAEIGKGRKVDLMAEKVETYADFKAARDMGFEYFQGHFFCKPEVVQTRRISSSQLNLLRLMSEVSRPDFNFGNLEKMIAPDVALSYKLLRYINSAFFAKAQEIASVQQALAYMGEAEIRRFISLIAMSSMAKGKPHELIRASCIRGKFCELLARQTRSAVPSAEMFTLGMFSLIDAVVDHPMEKVMGELPLSERIKDALVHRKGELLGYLGLIEYYEKGRWGLMRRICEALDLTEAQLPEIYLQACQWANTFTESD